MNSTVCSMLNAQLLAEFANANVYTYISSIFYRRGLLNLAKVFSKQSGEERQHGLGIIEFLDKQRLPYTMGAIDAAPAHSDSDDDTVIGWLETALALEKETTSRLTSIAAAVDPEDFTSQDFITKYLNEQIEEEDSSQHRLDQAKAAASDLMFDLYLCEK